MTETGNASGYIGGSSIELELKGAPFVAMVHFGVVDGRAACIGIDLRAFTDRISGGRHHPRPLSDWQPLTARRLRELRLEQVIEEAMAAYRGTIERALGHPEAQGRGADPVIEQARSFVAALARAGEAKGPGRPPTMSDADLAEVVVAAYRNHERQGGRHPVVAVRDALQVSGLLPGSGPHREVTISQARAAVRRARKLGLLPRSEEKS